jgi:predicted nucleotidyltransferase
MTQDEIIEMAIENTINGLNFNQEGLVRFANLVADKATEEANARANASWTLMCEKMVAIEREACAKLCDEAKAARLAEQIRARGEQA